MYKRNFMDRKKQVLNFIILLVKSDKSQLFKRQQGACARGIAYFSLPCPRTRVAARMGVEVCWNVLYLIYYDN